jgi:hypothetical protein
MQVKVDHRRKVFISNHGILMCKEVPISTANSINRMILPEHEQNNSYAGMQATLDDRSRLIITKQAIVMCKNNNSSKVKNIFCLAKI